jgi:hypothetical protein
MSGQVNARRAAQRGVPAWPLGEPRIGGDLAFLHAYRAWRDARRRAAGGYYRYGLAAGMSLAGLAGWGAGTARDVENRITAQAELVFLGELGRHVRECGVPGCGRGWLTQALQQTRAGKVLVLFAQDAQERAASGW